MSQNSFTEGNRFDEKTLSLENRANIINEIWDKFQYRAQEEKISRFDINELKNICTFILDEDKFDVKCYQTDRALAYMD